MKIRIWRWLSVKDSSDSDPRIVGSHSTNGVAALHSELLKQRVVPDFAAMFPERFNNKTNGVSPRRWLLLANPSPAAVITEAIGDGWVTDLAQLEKLKPLSSDRTIAEYAKDIWNAEPWLTE